jgi:hypothetical protein
LFYFLNFYTDCFRVFGCIDHAKSLLNPSKTMTGSHTQIMIARVRLFVRNHFLLCFSSGTVVVSWSASNSYGVGQSVIVVKSITSPQSWSLPMC